MKRLLLVLVSSAAMAAWGQSGLQPSKAVAGSSSNSGQTATVLVQGIDGRMHELEVPDLSALLVKGGSQSGCPVQIMDASFERPAQLVLTALSHINSGPTLRLNFANFSGKDIESVALTGWIKVKESPYQLDAVIHPFDLTLSRKALLAKDMQGTQALKLASNAIGFDRVELSQVIYADGTTWKPERRNCVYSYAGSTLRAEAR